MVETLHIIRRPNDPLALEAVQREHTLREVAVLLIQDGVLTTVRPPVPIYAGSDDVKARGVHPPLPLVSYPEICRLIREARRVIVW
ncbi:MAG: hypothetical protein HY760_05830 [Nitrospirae bacterium]|nr:hypothetical protein [Nitrospirota bacterium]